MVCPLARLGSKTGNSFVGKIRNLKIVNRVAPPVATSPTISAPTGS
jgi:hypothetical protein